MSLETRMNQADIDRMLEVMQRQAEQMKRAMDVFADVYVRELQKVVERVHQAMTSPDQDPS